MKFMNKYSVKFEKKFLKVSIYLILVFLFFLMQRFIQIPKDFKVFTTIILLMLISYLAYDWIKNRKSREGQIYFLFGIIIVVNRFYDKGVYSVNIPFTYKTFWTVCFCFVLARLMLPVVYKLFVFILENTVDEIESTKKFSFLDHFVKKRERKKEIHENLGKDLNNSSVEDVGKIVTSGKTKEEKSNKLELFIGLLLAAFAFIIECKYLMKFIIDSPVSINKNIILENVDTIIHMAFYIMIILFFTFSIGVIFTKLAKVFLKTIFNEDSTSYMALVVIGFIAVSVYLNSKGFNQDKLFNIFSSGDIFSGGLFILMLYGVFCLIATALSKLINEKYPILEIAEAKAKGIAKEVLEIGYQIITSILSLVKFMTSGLLESLLQIIEEGGVYDENEYSGEESGEHSGEESGEHRGEESGEGSGEESGANR